MGLPTVIKTWQRNVNQTSVGQGASGPSAGHLIRLIKNTLIGVGTNPWTVYYSCNATGTSGSPLGAVGTAGDGVDRWTSDADSSNQGGSGRFPFMVLQQTGVASHFQMLWYMGTVTSAFQMTFVISPSAGFTGGTVSTRPTATDEIVMISATFWINGQDVNYQYNAWQSSDGQCTRLSVNSTGQTEGAFWLLDVPQNVVSGWTNPSCSIVKQANSGLFASAINMTGNGRGGSTPATFTITTDGEGNGAGILPTVTGVGTCPNDFSNTWPFFGIGINSTTTGTRGRHGSLFDIWWRPAGCNPGQTFPNSATNRQFAAFGNLIHTWTSGSDVPLLA